MSGHTRRQVLAGVAGLGAAAVGAGTGRAGAAACDATVDTNARLSSGEPKLEVPPAETTVTGTSTCEPGSGLTVLARSSGGDSPFVKQVETAVADDGTWSATFGFEGQPPGTTFELSVRQGNETLATVEHCEVVAATATATPTGTDSPTPTNTPIGTGSPSPTPEVDLATPTPTPGPDAWVRLLQPLLVSLGLATLGLLAVGLLLVRWRLAPGGEEGRGSGDAE